MAKIMTNMKKHFIKIVIVFYIVASSFFYYGYIDDINNNNEALIKSIPIKQSIATKDDSNKYISSASCKSCHPSEYNSWYNTYHRTMTQVADSKTVLGRFDGTKINSRGLEYTVYKTNNQFWARVPDPEIMMKTIETGRRVNDYIYQIRRDNKLSLFDLRSVPRIDKRVVMTTGSHHYQTYWIEGSVYDPDKKENRNKYGNLLQTLPLVYLPNDDKWIPREDAFMRSPESKRMISQWNHHCIKCHSTHGNPGLNDDNTFKTEVAELGISCESCHGPAGNHVQFYQSPINRYSSLINSSTNHAKHIINPDKLDHKLSSQICGQCHGVYIYNDANLGLSFSKSGPHYNAGTNSIHKFRYYIQHPNSLKLSERDLSELENNKSFFRERWWDDGTILAGGREFSAMRVSSCYTIKREGIRNISCLDCHSMHHSDPKDQLKEGMSGNNACVQCHKEEKYTSEIERHTNHKTNSTGSSCLNCHMPHTSYALLGAIRSHQMQSPSALRSIEHGVPNACNLCHLDKTLQWTQEKLNKWYGHEIKSLNNDEKEISAWLLWLVKGDAAQRAIAAWHGGWGPAKNISGSDWYSQYLAELLKDPYSVVRYIAHKSLEKVNESNEIQYDFLASDTQLKAKYLEVLKVWTSEHPPKKTGSNILIKKDGLIDKEKFKTLLEKRNDRPVNIKE